MYTYVYTQSYGKVEGNNIMNELALWVENKQEK
jgi:hypothetical protein